MSNNANKRRSRQSPPLTDSTVLQHAGRLGHKYVVLQTIPGHERCVRLECASLERATEEADGCRERSPAIYRQVRRGVWERV